MLSEISQTEKDKYCTISLMCGVLKKTQIIETQRIGVCPMEGVGSGKSG